MISAMISASQRSPRERAMRDGSVVRWQARRVRMERKESSVRVAIWVGERRRRRRRG
jgi:hypothetical protein